MISRGGTVTRKCSLEFPSGQPAARLGYNRDMPIFEFRCEKCNKRFERIVFGQDTVIECPECGSRDVEKEISAFAVRGETGKRADQGAGFCAPGGT